ncbi:hypothetical protein TUBRATIS_007950 [Tubulinosema ratisbonensis]|uniref:Uncharacterized protein n=1 Tax=Tubulinosema ratisbonensis TaxID=291195 RepID=A0A437ANE8_9MICR|nr:hypothetical protein TUBRATIS_007950 [Tubulinosema ratisbonensis]
MDRIYSYTKLNKNNTAFSLDTLHLLSFIDTKFTLKEISNFFYSHTLKDKPIKINDKETLSLVEIFRTNPTLISHLNLKRHIFDLFSLMNTDISFLVFEEIKEFVLNNKEKVSFYLHTQGILNDTMCVCAIILSQLNYFGKFNTPKNLSFSVSKKIFEFFCEECLIKFAKMNDKFRIFYFFYCKENKKCLINQLVKEEFVEYNYFSSLEEYFTFLKHKIITEKDTKNVIDFYFDSEFEFTQNNDTFFLSEEENFLEKEVKKIQPINKSNLKKLDLISFLVEKEKDFLLFTNKEFLLHFKTNSNFTKKYIKFYIFNEIFLEEKKEFFMIYQAIKENKNQSKKLPLIKNYDWLNENEMLILVQLYLKEYSCDEIFDFIYFLNTNLNLEFKNIFNDLLYKCKFNLQIKEESFKKLGEKSVIKLVKECLNGDLLINHLDYNKIPENVLSILVKKVSNPLKLITKLITQKIKIGFFDELSLYDPSFTLPLIIKILENNLCVKVCKSIFNYLNNIVLKDDFFDESNLDLIKEIVEKTISLEDTGLERMKNECIQLLSGYAQCYKKRLRIRNVKEIQ